MTEHKHIRIIVEIKRGNREEVEFHHDRVTGREIKEAVRVPLGSELAAKQDERLRVIANDETITIINGEHFVVEHKEVTIHIDKKKYESPNPTTGAALYTLGNVPADYDLFEEIPGQGDDKLIPNDGKTIWLKDGLHFYTAKHSLNPGDGE